MFHSGYGDVVTQVLLQGLAALAPSANNNANNNGNNSPNNGASNLGSAGAAAAAAVSGAAMGVLPQNIRIISNFFRAAPDGTVRAFSQPVVHERYFCSRVV